MSRETRNMLNEVVDNMLCDASMLINSDPGSQEFKLAAKLINMYAKQLDRIATQRD